MPFNEEQRREQHLADIGMQVRRNRENQRIIDEQDRLWEEALEQQRRREQERRMRYSGSAIVHEIGNVNAGSTFYVHGGAYSPGVSFVETFFNSPPKPPKPRRRVVSPIFLGPAGVDQ